MRASATVRLGAILALALGGPVLAARSQPAPDPRIAPWAWERTEAGGSAPVIVVLRERADVSAADSLADPMDKRRFVRLVLQRTAERSQAPLRAWLDARGTAYRSFHVVNALRLETDRALLLDLAQRPEVARIVGDPRVRNPEPMPAAAPKAVAWNVALIGAPDVWALGFTGQGITVGIQDTGVRWTHEAIRDQYRGWDAGLGTASHHFHWHDTVHAGGSGGPCGTDSPVPCDDHGHGTHVAGTATGGDPAGDALGVAPGARWIACRNMDEGAGSLSSYLECFEFMLAPTVVGADPSTGVPEMAPDITSNSWVCPPSEGCAWDELEPAVEAHRAAGIMTIAAAGNSGPGCVSIGDPPAIYDGATTVGASDSADAMADFSSRGPTTPSGLIKPDLVAPGVGIRSAVASGDSDYDTWSGTSMAAPHVAGAVALLWSARPAYRGQVARTEELLHRTALRLSAIQEGCGGDDTNGPNATWGHGRIDIARAVNEACGAVEIACADAFDEDCDGAVDCDDADCDGDAACSEIGRCADGRDNDGDALTDCDDDSCDGDAACPEIAACADGRDNDADGLIDCVDPDCSGNLACPESANCDDGLDNDLDGEVDCADHDCAGAATCPEQGNCADGVDNDLDGSRDCDDDDCVGDAACPESAACANGRDDDGDTLVDCADIECAGDAACPEAGNCADGVDNDLDGAMDCEDAACAADAACSAEDFDGDGTPNGADCAPLDPATQARPLDVADLRLARVAPASVALAWTARPSGAGFGHDVASDDLAVLRVGGAAGACLTRDEPGGSYVDARPAIPAAAWYLVRAVNACGPSPANWGSGSDGAPRPGCP